MEFNLNNTARNYDGDPQLSLLHYLRDIEGIISPKNGCSPQGACGCCTVELNNRAVFSCVTPMRQVNGGDVLTIEGIDKRRQDIFANAFLAKGGVQCGFCIPGFVMRANALIGKNPDPSREEVIKGIGPNLCRCTGYKKIVDSILYAAEGFRGENGLDKPLTDGKVGTRLPKYDAGNLVLGQRPYIDDMKFEHMLYGALKFSDHPRAKVLSVDFSEALAVPGVVRIFTAQDIPGTRHTGLIVKDWPLMIEPGEETRYIGDVLAGVVAETETIARQAAAIIKVEYEVLTPVTSPRDALKETGHNVHKTGNQLSETVFRRGDLAAAAAETAFVSKGTYHTQRIEHAFMEPECSIALPWGDGGIEFYTQGQGVYEDQKQIASLLGLSLEQTKGTLISNGGAFGGKEDLSVQGHACLFALLLQEPVKVTLNRVESINMHPKRHPLDMDYELGCDKNGKFTYLKARIIGDTGAYASVGMKVLERAAGHASGAYAVPNADIDARAVYTNNIPCGAMRGFGVNQVTFAMESCIDDLCQQGGFDRWQIRYDNALREGLPTATGQILEGGVGIRKTLLALKDVFNNSKYAGIACGIKNSGLGNGMNDEGRIVIEVVSDQKVILHHGWTDMGQGVDTMAVQFLCEETGIDPAIVEVKVETPANAYAGMTTGSRGTVVLGNSVIDGAKKFSKALEEESLAQLAGQSFEGIWCCDWTTKPGANVEKAITHFAYSYATQVVVLDDDGHIQKVYAAHDAGKIINPTLFEGQIEGSIHMGLGYALSEDCKLEVGVPISTKLGKWG
ncbi:MAG: selenium-dependent xanthine dehydrogenase, partial [bacterium]|nr:selenium-dependent xanthine dehydrogenase [bacterium]